MFHESSDRQKELFIWSCSNLVPQMQSMLNVPINWTNNGGPGGWVVGTLEGLHTKYMVFEQLSDSCAGTSISWADVCLFCRFPIHFTSHFHLIPIFWRPQPFLLCGEYYLPQKKRHVLVLLAMMQTTWENIPFFLNNAVISSGLLRKKMNSLTVGMDIHYSTRPWSPTSPCMGSQPYIGNWKPTRK